MNVFAKFDEIPSITLQDIKETNRHGRLFVRSDGQRENSIPSHKHSLRNVFARFDEIPSLTLQDTKETVNTKAIKNYKGK